MLIWIDTSFFFHSLFWTIKGTVGFLLLKSSRMIFILKDRKLASVVLVLIIKMVLQNVLSTLLLNGLEPCYHATVHWPAVYDLQLWPFDLKHAVYLQNILPDPITKISRSPIPYYSHLQLLHVLGCPKFVLDPQLHDGKLPKWSPFSPLNCFIRVGHSPSGLPQDVDYLLPSTGSLRTCYFRTRVISRACFLITFVYGLIWSIQFLAQIFAQTGWFRLQPSIVCDSSVKTFVFVTSRVELIPQYPRRQEALNGPDRMVIWKHCSWNSPHWQNSEPGEWYHWYPTWAFLILCLIS